MVRVPSECCLCLKREAATAHKTAFRVSVSWFYWYRFLMFTWSRWGSVRLSSTECWQTEEPTEGRSYREVSPFVPTAFPAKTNPIARYWTWEKQKDDDSGCFYFIYSFTHLIWIIEDIKQAHWCLSISLGDFTGGPMVLPYRGTGPSLGSGVGAGWDDPSTTQTQCHISVSCVKTC